MRHDFAWSDARRTTNRFASAALLVALAVSTGGCVGKRIVIVDPDDGTLSLGQSDDLDLRAAGLQYDVVVDTVDMAIGEPITVYVGADAATVVEEGFGYEDIVQPDRRARVRATLPDGEVYLIACAGEDCAHRSPARRVKVTGSAGVCPLVQFVAPRAIGTGTLTLSAEADASSDGVCGSEYATPVRARLDVPDGVVARLWVDGLPVAQDTVANHAVDFGNVVLGVRGSDTSTLTLTIDGQPASCTVDHPRKIAVGCPGDSCRLVPPSPSIYLSTAPPAYQLPSNPSFHVDVTATSTPATVGQSFSLFLNGILAGLTQGTSVLGTVTAKFESVPVSFEGLPSLEFQAACPSTSGAGVRSAKATYMLDMMPCSVDLVAPGDGSVFHAGNDLDHDDANGMQIQTSLTLSGADCTGYRIAVCDALIGTPFTTVSATGSSTVVNPVATLGTSGTQELCAQVLDVAGNVSTDRITIGVAPSGPPMVAVVAPVAGTRFNHAGGRFAGVDYIVDMLPSTASCELYVTVDCSSVGNPVGLLVDGVAVSQSGLCVADATSSLGGRATIAGVSLGTNTTNHTLVARQTEFGLTGTSSPIAIGADCSAPKLSISSPMCGGWVDASDDVSPNAGIQTQVVVSSPNDPQVDVTLTLVRSPGTSTVVSSYASMLSPTATEQSFSALDFGTVGGVSLVAASVDSFGNATVTPVCSVIVARSPYLALTPLATTTFNPGNRAAFDCRPSTAGLDLAISGTTSASDGSQVTVQIGDAVAVVAAVQSGGFSACAPAPNGTSNVFASVTDVDGRDGVAGTAAAAPITITVSGVGP